MRATLFKRDSSLLFFQRLSKKRLETKWLGASKRDHFSLKAYNTIYEYRGYIFSEAKTFFFSFFCNFHHFRFGWEPEIMIIHFMIWHKSYHHRTHMISGRRNRVGNKHRHTDFQRHYWTKKQDRNMKQVSKCRSSFYDDQKTIHNYMFNGKKTEIRSWNRHKLSSTDNTSQETNSRSQVSNRRPFFTDVKAVVDLQVALIIIIKKLKTKNCQDQHQRREYHRDKLQRQPNQP